MTNESTILINRATDAFATIDALTTCTDRCATTRRCAHFDYSTALRNLLIDRASTATDPYDAPAIAYDFLRTLLADIDAAPYMTQRLSMLLLDNSLCPMHAIDYAICFDDDEPDCATLRAFFPDHDT